MLLRRRFYVLYTDYSVEIIEFGICYTSVHFLEVQSSNRCRHDKILGLKSLVEFLAPRPRTQAVAVIHRLAECIDQDARSTLGFKSASRHSLPTFYPEAGWEIKHDVAILAFFRQFRTSKGYIGDVKTLVPRQV